MENRLYRFTLNILYIFLLLYSIILFLGGVGVFLNNTIQNSEGMFLFFKAIIWMLLALFVRFIKKTYLPKKKISKNTRKKSTKGGVPMKIISIVLIFGMLGFYSPNTAISQVVRGKKFNTFTWEVKALLSELANLLTSSKTIKSKTQYEQTSLALEYFDLIQSEQSLTAKINLTEAEELELKKIRNGRIKIQKEVEDIISNQIKIVIRDYGIYNSLNKTRIFFPPVIFKFQLPPKLLTISHRDRLELKTTLLLNSGITPEEIEEIETRIAQLGYSAYIRQSTGLSLFPTVVYPTSLKRTLRTIAHEWMHTYIVFRPLGITRFPKNTNERQTIEETVATIFGDEIADEVWDRFYATHFPIAPDTQTPVQNGNNQNNFDYTAFLIETRQKVEILLQNKKIQEAEKYMNQRRDELEQNGYYERKINQAYFVATGFYATNPVYQNTQGVIGAKLIQLRQILNALIDAPAQSLAEFIKITTAAKNLNDIERALQKLSAKCGEFII